METQRFMGGGELVNRLTAQVGSKSFAISLLKKRGDIIILTDSAGQSIRFLIKGDEMVLKVYDKKGDLSLTSIFNEVPENRYK